MCAFVKGYDIVGGEIGLGLITEFIGDPIVRRGHQTISKERISKIPNQLHTLEYSLNWVSFLFFSFLFF